MPEALTQLPLPVPLQTRIAPAGVTSGTLTTSTITDPGIVNRLDSAMCNIYLSGSSKLQKRPGIEEVAKLLPSVRPRGILQVAGSSADYVLAICDDVLMVDPEPGVKFGERWVTTASAPWANKDAHQTKLVAFQGVILAIDGIASDVFSTTDGLTWTTLTSATGWSAREKFGVVATEAFVYVIGGHSSTTDRTDVWRSPDGITWTQVYSGAAPTSANGIAGSRSPVVAAVGTTIYWGFGGTNALPNGSTLATPTIDCMFKSVNDGVTWTSDGQITDSAGSSTLTGGLAGTVGVLTFPSGVTAIVHSLTGSGNPNQLRAYIIGGAGRTDILKTGLPISATAGWRNNSDGRLYFFNITDNQVGRFLPTNFQVHIAPTAPGIPTIPSFPVSLSRTPYTQAHNATIGGEGGLLLSMDNGTNSDVHAAVLSRSPANGFYPNMFPNGFAADDLLQYVAIDQFPPAIVGLRNRDEPPFEGAFIKSRLDAYWFNTADLVLSKVDDDAYPTLTTDGVAVLNSRVYVATPNGQIHNSEVNAPLDWRAVNFISARAQPDKLVGIARRFSYIGAFGTQSIEWFQDIGAASGTPLLPVDSAVSDYGCSGGCTIVNMNDTILFLGRGPRTGDRAVYILNGYTPEEVSTADVDRLISQYTLSSISAYALYAGGHRFYVLDFLGSSVAPIGGGTLGQGAVSLVYDLDAKAWYVWNSFAPQSLGSIDSATRIMDPSGYFRVQIPYTNLSPPSNTVVKGDIIEIRGTTPSAYSGEWLVDAAIDDTHFEVLMANDPGPISEPGIMNNLRNVPWFVEPDISDYGASLRFPISHSAFQVQTSGAIADSSSVALAFPSNIGQTLEASVFPILARLSSSVLFDNWTGRQPAVVGNSSQAANRSYIDYLVRTAQWDGGNNSRKFVSYIDVVGDQRDNTVKAWHRHTDNDRRSFTEWVSVGMDSDRPRSHRQGKTRRRVYDVRCPDTTQTARLERLEAFVSSDGVR